MIQFLMVFLLGVLAGVLSIYVLGMRESAARERLTHLLHRRHQITRKMKGSTMAGGKIV
jgi:hypothetical protein